VKKKEIPAGPDKKAGESRGRGAPANLVAKTKPPTKGESNALLKRQIEEQLRSSLEASAMGMAPNRNKLGFVKVGKGEEERLEEWDPDARISLVFAPTIEVDPSLQAFAHAGEKPGLEIWRIEKMIPVKWPRKKYGKFHACDSYICLSTAYLPGRSRTLEWSLHYWIGRKAPKDSQSAAAIRSIQLNEKIGGQAVHYRETQGHESEKFQQYFRYNIKYLKGGAGTALNTVTEEIYDTRLLQLLGANNTIVRQVDPECASLNEGDVFVLDTGEKLFVWVGKNAGLKKNLREWRLPT